MPSAVPKHPTPLVLVCGEDDFAVKQRAKQIYAQWTEELGGMDHEIIDAAASNGGEALKALGKLREALQTLPFFGTGKAIWFKDCNFLGEERVATKDVTGSLGALVEELNRRIAAGQLRNRAGQTVSGPIDGALLREDGQVVYCIRQGIPVLLIEEAILRE